MTSKTGQNSDLYIHSLSRYPIKGLSAEELETVSVKANHCFPYDRAYAIENGRTTFDPQAPKFMPKVNFLTLMKHERLALLDTKFDEETETLTIFREGRQLAKGCLSTSIGRNMIEQFIAAFMSKELKGPPKLLNAQGLAAHGLNTEGLSTKGQSTGLNTEGLHMLGNQATGRHFADCAEPMVHIINIQSVTALEHILNETINPKRFRANIVLAGISPWHEKQWQGKTLTIGDVKIQIIEETSRCTAINVDLKTAKRGRSIPATLTQHYKNENFGIYGKIIKGGILAKNDAVTISN